MGKPKRPNPPGNRSWKRDASGKMAPDLSRQPTAMRPEGIPDTAKTRGGKDKTPATAARPVNQQMFDGAGGARRADACAAED